MFDCSGELASRQAADGDSLLDSPEVTPLIDHRIAHLKTLPRSQKSDLPDGSQPRSRMVASSDGAASTGCSPALAEVPDIDLALDFFSFQGATA